MCSKGLEIMVKVDNKYKIVLIDMWVFMKSLGSCFERATYSVAVGTSVVTSV